MSDNIPVTKRPGKGANKSVFAEARKGRLAHSNRLDLAPGHATHDVSG